MANSKHLEQISFCTMFYKLQICTVPDLFILKLLLGTSFQTSFFFEGGMNVNKQVNRNKM